MLNVGVGVGMLGANVHNCFTDILLFSTHFYTLLDQRLYKNVFKVHFTQLFSKMYNLCYFG